MDNNGLFFENGMDGGMLGNWQWNPQDILAIRGLSFRTLRLVPTRHPESITLILVGWGELSRFELY